MKMYMMNEQRDGLSCEESFQEEKEDLVHTLTLLKDCLFERRRDFGG